MEVALETSREAGTYHAGGGRVGGWVGRDVATLLSLLGAALRKAQQQCFLPTCIRPQDLDAFLVSLGQLSARHAASASNATCRRSELTRGHFPCYHSRRSRGGSGPRGRGASGSVAGGPAPDNGGLRFAQQPIGPTPIAGGGELTLAWPQCMQFMSQQLPPQHQQPCTQSILDIPNAQSTPTVSQSASPGTARFFVSSTAVAMPIDLCSSGTGWCARWQCRKCEHGRHRR